MTNKTAAANAPRTFSFTTIFATAIPEDALKASAPARDTANDLPFKDWFAGNMETVMKEDKVAILFVPFSYFTTPQPAGRGIEADKVDGAYVKGKLRDQFNAWQGKTKVVVSEGIFEKVTRKNGKTGKDYVANGKVIKPEVAYNVERGPQSIVMMERTGKEKDLAGQKELGMTEPGIQLWLRATKEDRAKQVAAKAAADANKAAAEGHQPQS